MSPMSHRPADVDVEVQLRLVIPEGQSLPIPVSLRYSAADPYAVRALFRGDGLEVEWVFARDLLLRGLTVPAGEGDVRVWPASGSQVMVSLSSPDGRAVLEVDPADVRSFLACTTSVVALGQESHHVDLDSALEALLAES